MNTNLISKHNAKSSPITWPLTSSMDATVDAYKKNKDSSLLMDSVRAKSKDY